MAATTETLYSNVYGKQITIRVHYGTIIYTIRNVTHVSLHDGCLLITANNPLPFTFKTWDYIEQWEDDSPQANTGATTKLTRTCTVCKEPLAPDAKFCHACGETQ